MRPDVLQADTVGVHCAAVPPVVLDFAAAVPALLDGGPEPTERLRSALAVVKQCVVGRIQPPLDRPAPCLLDGDPVPERQAELLEEAPHADAPLRQVVHEERPARSQRSCALPEPAPAPLQVLGNRLIVADPCPVFLADVERRVGEDDVDRVRLDLWKHVQAVILVELPEAGPDDLDRRT